MILKAFPKGGMCMSCQKFKQDCSKLPFDKYPKIGLDKDSGMSIVLNM